MNFKDKRQQFTDLWITHKKKQNENENISKIVKDYWAVIGKTKKKTQNIFKKLQK